ncbi:MAG: redoxin domain-containing protein, partial [Candidatus Methylopumilus sp.]
MEINKKVPSFKLPGTSGLQFNLSDYKGQYLVIYFYPKDATPGCTTQGVDFRDAFKKFQ